MSIVLNMLSVLVGILPCDGSDGENQWYFRLSIIKASLTQVANKEGTGQLPSVPKGMTDTAFTAAGVI